MGKHSHLHHFQSPRQVYENQLKLKKIEVKQTVLQNNDEDVFEGFGQNI